MSIEFKLLGAEVVPVKTGSRTLKDATTAAIQDWLATADESYYVIGSVVGPHPYPTIVREFQKIIGGRSACATIKSRTASARYCRCLCRWWLECHGTIYRLY